MLAIIPAYRRPQQLKRCLESLAAGSIAPTPFIHDNSTDNLGFTAACNLGLRQALKNNDPYALLLNQDVYVRPDAVANLIAFMDAHPRCAIAGVKQVQADNENNIVHGGCLDAYPAGRHIVGHADHNDCAVSLPMPWVNGACLLVRMEAVIEIGLMDEGYFLIASDSDYCFTARSRGWEVWYCAEAAVLHESGGVSSQGRDVATLARLQGDQRRFRDKWLGSMGWELLKPPPPSRDLSPAEITTALQRMHTHYNKNELLPAELIARQLLAWEPGHIDATLTLARISLRNGLPALAAVDLEHLVQRQADLAPAWLALADAQILCNIPDRAIACYDRARALGINSADLHNNLGVAHLRQGNREAALAAWNTALSLDPNNPTAKKNLADANQSAPASIPQ